MDLTLLLPSQQKQEMDLMTLLNISSPNWVSKSDCLKLLSTSLTTLHKTQRSVELSLLRYFTNSVLEVNSTLGYRITQNINTDLPRILLSYLEAAPLFNLLTSTYTTDTYHATLLAESLYLSRASFYREVAKLNDFLNNYRLHFDSKNGSLLGAEADLRQFAYQFFWNAYKGTDFPLKSNSPLAVEQLLTKIDALLDLKLNPITKQKLRLSLTVSFREISLGNRLDQSLETKLDNDLFQLIYHSLQNQFYFLDKKNLKKESLFIYHSLLTQVLSINSPVFNQWVTDYFKDEHSLDFTYACQLLANLEETYPQLFSTQTEKLIFLTDFLIINLQSTQLIAKSLSFKSVSFKGFAAQYPGFYKDLLLLFTETEECFQLSPGSTVRFKNLLTTLEATLDLSDFERHFDIQIIAERETYSRQIKRELCRNSQHKLTFVDAYDELASPDLIITDTNFDTSSSASLYHLSFPPRATDWQEINQLLVGI